jgi:fructose-1,6-bisphosphatase/inositol monophosphatase family enzyme
MTAIDGQRTGSTARRRLRSDGVTAVAAPGGTVAPAMGADQMLELLRRTADAIAGTLAGLNDFGLVPGRSSTYRSDLAADRVAVELLLDADVGVLSEESGAQAVDRDVVVVVDPVDGSTNASRSIPWYATSLCALDADGPVAAVVVNLASGVRYEAVRHQGATRDGEPIAPSGCASLDRAMVAISGFPPVRLGWSQFRALGAAALDLCAVADGTVDAYVDCSASAHGPWDYLGALLVCRESGAAIGDAAGRELVVTDYEARLTPVAAATPALYAEAVAARSSFPVA